MKYRCLIYCGSHSLFDWFGQVANSVYVIGLLHHQHLVLSSGAYCGSLPFQSPCDWCFFCLQTGLTLISLGLFWLLPIVWSDLGFTVDNPSWSTPYLQNALWNVFGFVLLFASFGHDVSSVLSVMCASIEALLAFNNSDLNKSTRNIALPLF